MKFTEIDKYHAKLIILESDGNSTAKGILDLEMLQGNVNPILVEYYFLLMDLGIFVNSPEHKRLTELSIAIEIPEVLNYEIW